MTLGLILAEQGSLIEVNHLFPQQQAMNNTGLDQGGHLQAAMPTAEHDLCKQPATEVAGFIVGRDNAYPRH